LIQEAYRNNHSNGEIHVETVLRINHSVGNLQTNNKNL